MGCGAYTTQLLMASVSRKTRLLILATVIVFAIAVASVWGYLSVNTSSFRIEVSGAALRVYWYYEQGRIKSPVEVGLLAYGPYVEVWGGSDRSPSLLTIRFPLWAVIALLVVAARVSQRADSRRRFGYCTSCRYDRTGLPPDDPCPECGATAQQMP